MKTIDEIFGEMLSCLEEQTGLEPEPGCDLSVRMYAVGRPGLRPVHPGPVGHPPGLSPRRRRATIWISTVSCGDLPASQATQALGSIRFTAQSSDTARTIPQGTVCLTADMVRFETTEDGIIAPRRGRS